jgi:hypothetical protein
VSATTWTVRVSRWARPPSRLVPGRAIVRDIACPDASSPSHPHRLRIRPRAHAASPSTSSTERGIACELRFTLRIAIRRSCRIRRARPVSGACASSSPERGWQRRCPACRRAHRPARDRRAAAVSPAACRRTRRAVLIVQMPPGVPVVRGRGQRQERGGACGRILTRDHRPPRDPDDARTIFRDTRRDTASPTVE